MYCNNCGHQSPEDFRFCPKCGAERQAEPAPAAELSAPPVEERFSTNPAAQFFLSLLKDKLFFVICILMTVSSGAAILTGSLPIIEILITVFLWLLHAQAEKNVADAGYLRCVSGSIYANYILVNVCAVLCAVFGLIFGAAFDMLIGNTDFIDGLRIGLAQSGAGSMVSADVILEALSWLSGSFLMIAFILAGAVMLVLNIFTTRYVHRFVKSAYQSIRSGALALKHASATRVVLIIFAAIYGFDALDSLMVFSLTGLLSSGAACAVCILTVLLMNKYLFPKKAAQ